eukprot:scaffold74622_cov56-Cyclotella_meneghiniana.AAC.3
MKSASISIVYTDVTNNIAVTGYFSVAFQTKHLNTILDLLSPPDNICLAHTAAASYLPDNIVVGGTPTVNHSDFNIGLYMVLTPQYTTQSSYK